MPRPLAVEASLATEATVSAAASSREQANVGEVDPRPSLEIEPSLVISPDPSPESSPAEQSEDALHDDGLVISRLSPSPDDTDETLARSVDTIVASTRHSRHTSVERDIPHFFTSETPATPSITLEAKSEAKDSEPPAPPNESTNSPASSEPASDTDDSPVPFLMQSAHLVRSSEIARSLLAQIAANACGDADGEWTAVDHAEAPTPRAESPALSTTSVALSRETSAGSFLQVALPSREENEGQERMDDLAVSAVFLTQSQYTPLPPPSGSEPDPDARAERDTTPRAPDLSTPPPQPLTSKLAARAGTAVPSPLPLESPSTNDAAPASEASSSPISSASSSQRIHSPDRPDWAVAPSPGSPSTKARRHSVSHPDWAVAPAVDGEEVRGDLSRGAGQGRSKRKRTRRGRHSR